MRGTAIFLAACLLLLSHATPILPIGNSQSPLQPPLEDPETGNAPLHQAAPRQLHGRFLHITDIHPDPHYKVHASTEEDAACHRGKGTSGTFGAETSDCDTPFALVNETFKWIETHLKDQIDFVVWTGDSARHDNDERIPRNQDEVLSTNTWIAEKFIETFSDAKQPNKPLSIPIISTFGNNDILPHNILLSGPNKWLKAYTDIWGKFIPEEQRHGFERGGWYYVEVIPQRLAVFSLNTLYFFDHNAAVDGCALRSEPGYEHMEWLRIQLEFMRQRGMKAILTGHVPPARTDSKQLWDETCWQKYTLWLQQYRDVVVGGLFGHMNIDHFMIHDSKQVEITAIGGHPAQDIPVRVMMEEELTIQSANDYLEELREHWARLPNPARAIRKFDVEEPDEDITKKKKGKKGKKKKGKKGKKNPYKKIGGPWGERFQVTNVGPSVVPNFLPTLRIMEYNLTGLDLTSTWANPQSAEAIRQDWIDDDTGAYTFEDYMNEHVDDDYDEDEETISKKKRKHKKPKKPTDPDLIIPSPPSKSAPPGPAYSPQTLTLLGYTQYFANLTSINNENLVKAEELEELEDLEDNDEVDTDRWREGKHKGKHPKDEPSHPNPFQYQVEYDTFTDPIYNLPDLTVRSWLKLAHRIGQYKPNKGDEIETPLLGDSEYDDEVEEEENDGDDDTYEAAGKKKHRKKKHHRQNEKNKVWLRFVRRAFVGTLEEEELQTFEDSDEIDLWEDIEDSFGRHTGEL